jgi:hypothetical protein
VTELKPKAATASLNMKFLSVLEEVLRVAAIMAILLIGFVQLLILIGGGAHDPGQF